MNAVKCRLQSAVHGVNTKGVKIFTLKMPTLIIKVYILTRFKGEHGPYKGTGSERYTIKKVTWRGLSDP